MCGASACSPTEVLGLATVAAAEHRVVVLDVELVDLVSPNGMTSRGIVNVVWCWVGEAPGASTRCAVRGPPPAERELREGGVVAGAVDP